MGVGNERRVSSLEKNKTWRLTTIPKGKRALENKWIFGIKEEVDVRRRFKAWLVVKGLQRIQDLDYTEAFSPVVELTTIRVISSLVADYDLFLEQTDVKIAFLHCDLEVEIYMVQPKGFFVSNSKDNLFVASLKTGS